jgi:uncharacterized protein (DUF1786 family)
VNHFYHAIAKNGILIRSCCEIKSVGRAVKAGRFYSNISERWHLDFIQKGGRRAMSKFLILDIGAGTLDILYYSSEDELHYKAVVKSPILTVEEKIRGLPGNLLLTGREMGGGIVSKILTERARKEEVIVSASAAATLHHSLQKVRSWGIRVIDDSEAEQLKRTNKYSSLVLQDLDVGRLKSIVEGFGIPFQFDILGICAQDHGTPPEGVSHLDYRHQVFKAALDKDPFPHALLFRDSEIPSTFTRLRSIAESARLIPAKEIYVTDSGMAAILGGSMDSRTQAFERVLVLDIATSHTVGAILERGEMAGWFEYHTRDITLKKLDALLIELADGTLDHERILREGGHGAHIRRKVGKGALETIVATGPKRSLVQNSRFPMILGAPLGDNMMTGTVGILEAIRSRKNLPPISYA